jgi:hypothetical protein
VHTVVGILPLVAGKPETPIFEEAVRRFGARSPLFLGDRLDTDILGARRAGMRSAHVLTGIDTGKQLVAAAADSRPDYVLEDLRQLFEPYPVVERKKHVTRVRDARVAVRDGRVELLDEGLKIDVLRATCAAVWESGVPLYALEVPADLYR